MEDLSEKVLRWTSMKLNAYFQACVCVFLFWFYRKALYPKELFFHYVGNNEFEIVKQNASVDSYDVFLNP